MANTSVVLRDGQEALPVALRSDLTVTTFDSGGAGRLLHQAYTVVGGAVEKSLGRAAHKLGSGPIATSGRIEKALGDDALTRQSTLDSIYDSFREGTTTQHLRALKKDCQKLLTYALPSRSSATQIHSFKSIIRLTTRHPGLRRVFLQSPDIIKAANSPDAIRGLWRNADYDYDRESLFTLNFAANCLARSDPSSELEKIRPSELGCTRKTGLGILDMLVVGYCDEGSGFPRLIAIRYLAGILELPAFWLERYYQVHKLTMDKLCKQTLRLIEDVNPDSVTADDVGRLALLDPDGVDALADAVLVGGRKWIQRKPRIQGLESDYWLPNFIKIIDMLRGLIISDFLPSASRRAAGKWENLSKDITHQLPKSNSDCRYEDDYVRATNSSRSNWRPSDLAEESLNIDDERPSLLKTFTTAFRTAFLGQTSATPSDPLSGESSGRKSYNPETILAEESDDETMAASMSQQRDTESLMDDDELIGDRVGILDRPQTDSETRSFWGSDYQSEHATSLQRLEAELYRLRQRPTSSSKPPWEVESDDDGGDSPGHQLLEEELYKLRQRRAGSPLSYNTWEVAQHNESGDDSDGDSILLRSSQITPSDSPTGDDSAGENYLGPGTTNTVEERSRSADVENTFHGTGGGNLTPVAGVPVGVLDVRDS